VITDLNFFTTLQTSATPVKAEANSSLNRAATFSATPAKSDFEISFMSEEPYVREYFTTDDNGNVKLEKYVEILSMDNPDLRFAASGHCPFLLDHNTCEAEDQIGVITKCWIEDKRGKALIRFSVDPAKQGIIDDIKSGIRNNISVGYQYTGFEPVESPIDGIDAYRFSIKVNEISSVAIPADTTVGTNRASSTSTISSISRTTSSNKEETMTSEVKETGVEFDLDAVRSVAIKEAQSRAAEITKFCESFGFSSRAADLINSDKDIVAIKTELLQEVEKRNVEVPKSPVDAQKAPAFHQKDAAHNRYNFGRAIAMAAGAKRDGVEAEIDQEYRRNSGLTGTGMGYEPDTIILPRFAREAGMVRAPHNAGYLSTPAAHQGDDWVNQTYDPTLIDVFLPNNALAQLPVTKRFGLTGIHNFKKKTGTTSAAWGYEGDAAVESHITTAPNITATPKRLSSQTSVTDLSMVMTDPNVQANALADLQIQFDLKLSDSFINGGGSAAPAYYLDEAVTANGSYEATLGTGGAGAIAEFEDYLALVAYLEGINASSMNSFKWLINTSIKNKAIATSLKLDNKTTKNTIAWALLNPVTGGVSFAGHEAAVSNQLATVSGKSKIIGACWSDVVWANWGNLALRPLAYTGGGVFKFEMIGYFDFVFLRHNTLGVIHDALV
jgi:HK97 family phage major capsid protein